MLTLDALTVQYGTGVTIGPESWVLGSGVHHLTGPNGSGKTTLLRAITADLHPTSGRVTIHGRDVHTDPKARRHIGFLPAVPDLPGHLTVDEAWQTMAALRGVPDWLGTSRRMALELPGDLRLAHGSSGQRRRAALLAAWAADPLVMVLDEPFVHLDTQGQEQLRVWMEQMRESRVILITHHGPLPVDADTVLPMRVHVSPSSPFRSL